MGALAVAVGVLVFLASRSDHGGRASDKALESALLAPCCFNGTLISHDSEIAHELRAEIETRYAHGESTEAIESDMVARYTERIRAMPNERAFSLVPALAAGVAVLASLLLGLFVLRLRREDRTAVASAVALPAGPADEYDARIDAELSNLD